MTNKGKLCVLVGGQYGSEGKGAIAAHIANDYGVHVRVGSPNAGHTIYWKNDRHVMQTIPCGWINPNAKIVIGRGALISPHLLVQELAHIEKYYPNFRERLYIDPMAGVLDDKFREQEGGVDGDMHARIGSTGEGVGLARQARISRDPSQFRLFRDISSQLELDDVLCEDTPGMIASMQNIGTNVLIEGTQGSALSLFHSFYPYCTSTDTNASGIAAEVGIAPTNITDVLMVCRTYPIRVAGNSGYMRGEITWDEVSKRAGREVIERTTVTKKIRRVAEWDSMLFNRALVLNNPTEIALTFCDYIDPNLYGCTDPEQLQQSELLNAFMDENNLTGKVKYFGTSPTTVVEV